MIDRRLPTGHRARIVGYTPSVDGTIVRVIQTSGEYIDCAVVSSPSQEPWWAPRSTATMDVEELEAIPHD